MTLLPFRSLRARAGLVLATLGLALAPGCADGGSADESSASNADEATAAVDLRVALAGKTLPLASAAFDNEAEPFESNGSFLAVSMPFAPFKALFNEVVAETGARLKNRGEAHITVLTPPEVSALRSKLSMSEIESLARDEGLQQADVAPDCLGVGSVGSGSGLQQTLYVVVHSQGIANFRAKVARTFRARGGSAGAFDAERYFPHVTVGFTKRDLHEQDGVLKTVDTCPSNPNLDLVP
jgi:hypothetical protein